MISPRDIASGGYLNSPVSVAANGYIAVSVDSGGGGAYPVFGAGRLLKQIQQDDEEIMVILMAFMGMIR